MNHDGANGVAACGETAHYHADSDSGRRRRVGIDFSFSSSLWIVVSAMFVVLSCLAVVTPFCVVMSTSFLGTKATVDVASFSRGP